MENYAYFMKRYSYCQSFIYVGDNVKKDFITPNALGWKTICLKDDGRNIHKQDFTSTPAHALTKEKIKSLKELI